MLLLRRHLLPLLRAGSPLPSSIHHRACLLSTFSTSAAPFSLEDYLVAACGLAPAQARMTAQKTFDDASKRSKKKAFEGVSWSRLNSASNPDAILALLSGVGLSRTDIAAVVAADPLLLRSSVNSIAPRLLALRDRLGLSAHQIVRFLLVNSRALRSCEVVPKLQFLISFYGSFEQVLVAAKRSNVLLRVSLERVIDPNIALFRQFGVRGIAQLCSNTPRLLTLYPERVKELLLRAEELGVPRASRMFKYAVALVAGNSKEKVAARLEFLKRTLDCSECQVSIAVSRLPGILGFSSENVLRKIEFLINEVLQEKGLLSSNKSFYKLVQLGEEDFKLKFIDCHKDSVPVLADAYAAARAGSVPVRH